MQVLFAPLQGYTTGIYRKAHAEIFGGVDAYYAPFLRIENGRPRERNNARTAKAINKAKGLNQTNFAVNRLNNIVANIKKIH